MWFHCNMLQEDIQQLDLTKSQNDTVLDKTVEFCTVSKLTSSHPKHSTTPPALLNGI